MPLSHLTLTVSHLPTSTSFFLSCLQPLGYQFIGRHDDYIGFGQNSNEPADFWITEQKPGSPAGAAHVAFPAPSKDAVHSFFICALKAGGKIHGEPKLRDSQSGYFSAAIMDVDGNSIEAVYRPSNASGSSGASSVARSELTKPALALLESGSVVSKASSKVSSIKTESIAPPRSDVRSYTSKAVTAVERAALRERGTTTHTREIQQAPSPTYVVQTHTTQKADDGTTAKTIVGSLIGAAAGAAAGAALAYALSSRGDSEKTETKSAPQFSIPQYSAEDIRQLIGTSQAPSQAQEYQGYAAIEAPPARSIYSQAESRPGLTRSMTSKNPRASTIYEGTEFAPRGGSIYMDESGRRASEGTVYTSASDLPIRAIEYPPQLDSQDYPGDMSTLISSFRDKSRISDKGSVYSQSTIKPTSKSYYEDQQSSRRSSASSYHGGSRSQAAPSTASSNRTARQIPLPEGSIASFATYRTGASKSGFSSSSRHDAPFMEDTYDDAYEVDVGPEDSISQIGDPRRSSHSHASHRSHTSKHSRTSKHSNTSKFDEPVKPSDSVSQISSHASRASQRTVKASGSIAGGASKAGSRMSSRRSSQVA